VSLRRQLRGQLPAIAAITVMVLIAAGTTAVILDNQRLRLPWADRYTVAAEFESGKAVTPGQGQTVNVAGIQVGEIGDVSVEDGVAVVELVIDPAKLPAVYRDARMVLRPRTGLGDQTVELDPGTEPAGVLPEDEVLPVARTRSSVDLDQVLSILDADARAYLTALLNVGGEGIGGSGRSLGKALGAVGPVVRRSAAINETLREHRASLRRLVTNLGEISTELADRREPLGELVASANRTFTAVGERERELAGAVNRLPGALRATAAALRELEPFARAAGPTFERLRTTASKAEPTLRAARPLVTEGTPALADVRRFAEQARPLVADARPVASELVRGTPHLTRSFDQLRYATNELAYVPDEPFDGYLFWAAWLIHNGHSVLSSQDAHGAYWRINVIADCNNISGLGITIPVWASLFTGTGACEPQVTP
jgi:phospholipid/cholesterol/gamma-HCH transport system substrate-binding protein